MTVDIGSTAEADLPAITALAVALSNEIDGAKRQPRP
jgi:hypothetical protein